MCKALGFSDENSIDDWRRKLGNVAEHHERKGSHRGIWLHAPTWLPLYFAASGGQSSDADVQLVGKRKQEFYDGELAALRYLERRRELVPAAEVEAVFGEIAGKISRALTLSQRISRDATEPIVEALEDAKKAIIGRFTVNGSHNGHIAAPRVDGQPDRTR